MIARGNARAVRQNVTVMADRLTAFYRPRNGAPVQPAQSIVTGPDTGGNEIYRVQADGACASSRRPIRRRAIARFMTSTRRCCC